MSTPTTTRGALLRRAGILLVAAALVGAPATSALADPTATPTSTITDTTTSPTTTAGPTASATPSPSGSTSSDPTPTTTGTAPAPSGSPTQSAAASATASPRPTETPTATPAATLLRGATRSLLAGAAAAPAPQTAYAADFVARTLSTRADHYDYPGGDWFDGGNTIDAIIALAASGSGSAEAGRAFDYLTSNLNGPEMDSYDGVGSEKYAGPTAKALLGAIVAGANPRDVGGLDLVAALEALESPSGRFSDVSAWGDNSNTIGQALAIIALVRSGEGVSTAAIDLLAAQQCADGGFRGAIGDASCSSDADATAFAAQALIAVGATSDAAAALDHLVAIQRPDGGLASTDGVANANTTGVAAQAFAAGGRDAELADARAFLVGLQYACSSPAALRGGIAFSTAKRSTTSPSDEDIRATPQSALGLSGQSLLSVQWTEGASEGTTATPCASTPTTPPSPSVEPTSNAGPPAGDGGSDPSGTVAAAPSGSLAQTGTDLWLPALLGLLLVVVGGVAVFASTRRRGAHA